MNCAKLALYYIYGISPKLLYFKEVFFHFCRSRELRARDSRNDETLSLTSFDRLSPQSLAFNFRFIELLPVLAFCHRINASQTNTIPQ